jgi:hypothetical protein
LACFQARVVDPFPEGHSRHRCGSEWLLAGASDWQRVPVPGRTIPGLGDVVTKHDADNDRDVEVVMGAVLQAVGGGRHG